jgi:hypothetical protein
MMVTIILAFIFLTPHSVFKDSPNQRSQHPNEIVVRPDGANGFIYELGASAVAPDESDTLAALKRAVEPVVGDIVITRFEQLRSASGKVAGYRIWAHR